MDRSQGNHTEELLSLLTGGQVPTDQLRSLFGPVLAESHEVIYSFDHSANRFVFLTPNAPALFGLTEKELALSSTETLNSYVHPDDFSHVMEQWDKLEQAARHSPETAAGKMRYRWRRGQQYIWLEQCFRFLLDEQGRKHIEVGFVRDVNREHERTLELQQSQRILDSIEEAVVLLDKDRRVLWINQVAAEAAGMKAKECIGRNCRNLWHNPACDQCPIEDVLATGKPMAREITTEDGRRWHNWFYPTPGLAGQSDCITEIARDITAEYEARAEMRLAQERFDEAISAAGHVLYRYNPRTDRFDYISASCEEILGFTQEELMQFAWQDSVRQIHPEDWPGTEAIIAAARDSHTPGEPKAFSAEYRWARKDGRYVWVSLSATMRFDAGDELIAIIGSVHDITDRKQAEGLLAKTQQYFDEALETTRHLLYRYNIPMERFDYISPYAETLFGKPLDEVVKIDYPQMLKEIHPEDRDRVERAMLDTRQPHDPGSAHHSQLEYRRQYGREERYIWMLHYRTVLYDENGWPESVIGSAYDITESKRAEMELRKAHDLLEHRVTERTAELRRAYRKLLDAREAERRHLAAELHDSVAQQIVAIQLLVHRMASQICDDTLAATSRQAMQDAIDEIRRVSEGLYPPGLAEFGLRHALRGFCKPYHLAGRSIHLDWLLDPDRRFTPEVEIVLFRIAQEAINNAVRHSQGTEIVLSVEEVRGHLLLLVRDNGQGFTPADQIGTGRGLENMLERAKAVDGTVDIKSGPEGTTLVARIPAIGPNGSALDRLQPGPLS